MRTRLQFPTRTPANAFAAAIHARMISTNREYATAVSRGQIARWAFSYQDLDVNGQPISTNWFVNVKPRCDGVLTRAESGEVVNSVALL